MSQITNYIRSLPEQSFESIKTHFTDMGCKISEDGERYMISIPIELDTTDKPFLHYAVGTIFSKNTNELLCFGFPKTIEMNKDSFPIEGSFYASEYIVGTLLRAYWDGTIWRLTTNGNMNAYESYWISSKSFGELFDACLSRIYKSPTIFSRSPLVEKLNKSYCYQFLLSDPTVHLHQNIKPYIYHVGTFNLTTNSYINTVVSSTLHTPIVHTFNNKEELEAHLVQNREVLGYIVYTDVNSQTPRYKYLKDSFAKMKELLGNTPNMYLRYLECKYEGREIELLMNVPSIRYYSSWIEKCLSEITTTAYSLYVEKYIKRQTEMFINYFYRPILHDLHMKYNELRTANPDDKSKAKITMTIVHDIIHKYHPKRLHFILNGLKYLNTMEIIDPTTQEPAEAVVEQTPCPCATESTMIECD